MWGGWRRTPSPFETEACEPFSRYQQAAAAVNGKPIKLLDGDQRLEERAEKGSVDGDMLRSLRPPDTRPKP